MLSSAVTAQEAPDWLQQVIKSETPNELAYYVGVPPSCSLSEERLTSEVEGILVRSRIKPRGSLWISNPFYLSIDLQCLKMEGRNPITHANIQFARHNPKPSIAYEWNFGTLLIGDDDYTIQAIKKGVERAITAYLKANFDL